jgi:hypothetical protein
VLACSIVQQMRGNGFKSAIPLIQRLPSYNCKPSVAGDRDPIHLLWKLHCVHPNYWMKTPSMQIPVRVAGQSTTSIGAHRRRPEVCTGHLDRVFLSAARSSRVAASEWRGRGCWMAHLRPHPAGPAGVRLSIDTFGTAVAAGAA